MEFAGNEREELREIIHTSKSKHTLPYAAMGKVWATFQFSAALPEAWSTFLCNVKAPLSLHVKAQFTLKLLVDNLLKAPDHHHS